MKPESVGQINKLKRKRLVYVVLGILGIATIFLIEYVPFIITGIPLGMACFNYAGNINLKIARLNTEKLIDSTSEENPESENHFKFKERVKQAAKLKLILGVFLLVLGLSVLAFEIITYDPTKLFASLALQFGLYFSGLILFSSLPFLLSGIKLHKQGRLN